MTRFPLIVAGALLLSPVAVAAQQASTPATAATPTAAPTVGATVYDTSGAPVGTIATSNASVVTIDTGSHKVPVPASSIGHGAKGALIAMTQAQLNTAYEQASAQATAQVKQKLVAGTPVSGVNGTNTIATIKAADDQYVTLTTSKGDVKLPVSAFSTNAKGTVIVGMTAEQFDAALSSTTPAASTPATPPAG